MRRCGRRESVRDLESDHLDANAWTRTCFWTLTMDIYLLFRFRDVDLFTVAFDNWIGGVLHSAISTEMSPLFLGVRDESNKVELTLRTCV